MISLPSDEDTGVVGPSGGGVGRDPFPNDKYPPAVIEVVISIGIELERRGGEPSETGVVEVVGPLGGSEVRDPPPTPVDDMGGEGTDADERDGEGNDEDETGEEGGVVVGIKDEVGADDAEIEYVGVDIACWLFEGMAGSEDIEIEEKAGTGRIVETSEICDEDGGIDPVEGRFGPGSGSGTTVHCQRNAHSYC